MHVHSARWHVAGLLILELHIACMAVSISSRPQYQGGSTYGLRSAA